ncbi:MAG: hypothetical protein QNK04_33250 [Myxococcota bacterium]|nr:hypothetical protein [Myxococcota bacterium]
MRGRPSAHTPHVVFVLAAVLAAGCAGTRSPGDETVAEGGDRDVPRSLLEATTPQAAARAEPTSNDPQAQPGPGRPGRLLIYSAVTGHVPLRDQARDPSTYRTPAEQEAARARSLEAEIEEEMARQEQLSVVETASAPSPPPAPAGATDPDANPLDAQPAPTLRDLPARLFEREQVEIPAGAWQNPAPLRVERRALDIDDDGRPEEVRYLDPDTGEVLRAEQDLDFDGRLDAWVTFEGGQPVVRVLDTSGDGEYDVWERYDGGQLDARTVDRDADGVRDLFYRYADGQLTEKSHDGNNDGTVDKIETFQDRYRKRVEEDRSLNGNMDTWTTYTVVEGKEVVATVERDSRDRGKPDVFETYETRGGETRLVRREEDVNGDGSIDVISVYEDGKLVQRAISDEALSPL